MDVPNHCEVPSATASAEAPSADEAASAADIIDTASVLKSSNRTAESPAW